MFTENFRSNFLYVYIKLTVYCHNFILVMSIDGPSCINKRIGSVIIKQFFSVKRYQC